MTTWDPMPSWKEPSAISKWAAGWQPAFQRPWLTFLDTETNYGSIFASARLLFPSLLMHEECIFLEMNFSESSYISFKDQGMSRTEIELVMNHVHVEELIHETADYSASDVESLAGIISEAWSLVFRNGYEERGIEVVMSSSENLEDLTISFHSIIPNEICGRHQSD